MKPRGREPPEVLLRLFGKHLQQPTSNTDESSEYFIAALVLENVIFTLLSERNLGPKLLGVFAGGRLEEFIEVKLAILRILKNFPPHRGRKRRLEPVLLVTILYSFILVKILGQLSSL